MFGSLFKPLTEAYIESEIEFDNVVTLESISDFISEYGATSTELICEMYTMSLYSTELILENIFEFDNNMVSFINEGIIGSLLNLIRKIIYTAYTFLNTLLGKVTNVIDRYSNNNEVWLSKYRKAVEERIPVGRSFTYTGTTKWDLSYCTSKKYPAVITDLVKVSAKVEKALVSTSTLMNNNSAKESDFDAVKSELTSGLPKGFKAEAVAGYERALGCKITEISTHFLNKGRGPKGEVLAFRAINPKDMLLHIENTHKLIGDTREEISTALEEANSIFDILDKRFKGVADMDDKIKEAEKSKVQNNSASMFSVLNEKFAQGTVVQKLPPKNTTKEPEKDLTKDAADKELAAAEKAKDNQAADNKTEGKTPEDTGSKEAVQEKSIDYMTTLQPILKDSFDTWNTTLMILSRIQGVRIKLTEEACAEFIKVLTKFANTKFK